MLTLRRLLVLGAVLVAAVGSTVGMPAAHAQGRVSVTNEQGRAVIDPTYATTLKVGGSGFQSIRGGHGGIYVFFGTVSSGWRPSQGGVTGKDYFYVPDSESAANAGHQKYVAFPGSDTASSANGGVVSANGRWSTTITVPGARFQAVDRNGKARSIDCRKVTCGIITVGAHGVANAANETFTPVSVADLYGGRAPAEQPALGSGEQTGDAAVAQAPASGDAGKQPKGKPVTPTLSVDRPSAVAGRTMSFTARGLTPGAQVSAVLDDGVAAAGPFLVGAQGQVTGVVTLPLDVSGGTHELRLYGLDGAQAPVVRFAIAPGDDEIAPASATTGDDPSRADTLAPWFFGAAGVVLLAALGARVALGVRGRRARA